MSNSTPDTLPKYFLHSARKFGSRVALRQKELGIWREFSWADSYREVREICLGLVAMGVERGDRIAMVGDNDRFYLWGDIALVSAGAILVGIFTDSRPEEMEYVINHSDSILVMAKDQEQVDKLLSIKERIPLVKNVIYWDDRGMWGYDDDWLLSLDDVKAAGRTLGEAQPTLFEDLIAQGKAEDYANFCYTSGTTGAPKGAMLTHTNFIAATGLSTEFEPRYETDNLVSFSPLAWIAEHTLCVTPHLMYGIIINFPESPSTVQENIREIGPDVLFFPGRLWENAHAMIQIRMTDTSWINRVLYKAFLPIGYKAQAFAQQGKPIGLPLRFMNWLGEVLVFRPLRWQFGLGRVRTALTAGVSLSPDVMNYFHATGLKLKQVFASTETAAAAVQHTNDLLDFNSVGVPMPGVKLEIAPDGEILLGGPNIFHGYFKNDEATGKSLHVDESGMRWFHTGDAGYIGENGQLVYLDRVKDMIQLPNGERYSPQFIEGRLKFSPYIRDVMVVGGGEHHYITALIAIDFENVGRWAEKNRIPYTTFLDLAQKPEIMDLISKDVERVNQSLQPAVQIRRAVLLHKEFDADEAEMTRTRKLRRGFLVDRYRTIIDAMYRGDETVKVQAQVRYRDGREGTVDSEVRIMSFGAPIPNKETVLA